MLEVTGEINSGLSGNKTSNEPHRHSHTRVIAALFKGSTKGLGGCGAGRSGWCLKREKKAENHRFSLTAAPRGGCFARVWGGSVEEA